MRNAEDSVKHYAFIGNRMGFVKGAFVHNYGRTQR